MSRSDRVTDLIMHYYMEHGRNRDLEKYLRLRRVSNVTRSSSDGSLPCLDELQRRTACRSACDRSDVRKSMENLSTLRKKAEQQQLDESEKSLRNASAESAKSVASKSSDKVGTDAGGSSDAKCVKVKETKVEHKSGRNFNFNLESVIEINLPPPPTITLGVPTTSTVAPITYSQPEPLQTAPKQQVSPRVVVHENSTQTAASEDDPIRPVVKAHVPGTMEEPLDSTKDLSPGSSIASNKQRLEWDSLGDIGYDSSERLQFCGAADLNETEKRCLQRYFARKGLTFDRSVIVVRQRDEKEKKPARTGEDTSIMQTKPDAQSTPKLQPHPAQPSVQQKVREEAKSTQTSLYTRGKESRGVQVTRRNEDLFQRQDKAIGTTDSYTLASVDAAESFEFFSPSVPETENNTPSVAASVSTPVHSSSNTSSSTANEASSSNRSMRPMFDDEVKLGLTLYNSICELKSMPTGVKESLIDKIFRKLSRHDPKRRTREQLLQDYGKAVRRRKENEQKLQEATGKEESNVYDDVSPCTEKDDESHVDNASPQLDRSMDVVEVIEETKDPLSIAGSVNVSEGSVQASATGSNEGKNGLQNNSSREVGSLENSSHRTVSSQPVSAGTTKENLPRKMSAPEPRDKRVRKAMQDYLKPMTHSEVEYENFRQLRQLNQERANDPQLAKIDREIEQLLVKKMLLLNVGPTVTAGPTLPVKDMAPPAPPSPAIPVPLPSERSGTVYTSVHDPVSVNSSSKDSSSSAWNSHYHMAKVIKNRSKLETPTALSSTPSDVSIPTFIKQKQEKFVENYDQVRTRRAFEEQNHIYTRPYSSGGHRSDRRHLHEKENHAFRKDRYALSQLPKGKPTDCRAISSSNNTIPSPEFISSDSISIPVVTTLTNTTTTHHYDIKSRIPSPTAPKGRTAGTQTTDSILRTKPIFGEKKPKPASVTASVQVPSTVGINVTTGRFPVVECNCPCGQRDQKRAEVGMDNKHHNPRRTEIVNGGRQDKQAQTKPSSIAYVITFEGTSSERKGHNSPVPSTVSSSESAMESEQENGKDDESEKMLTLREQFRRSCPATLSRIEERRQCISELNKLRSKRNQQRQRLLLLTSDDLLRKTTAQGRSQLPPPPLSQRRVFASTRAIRENTRRQVRKLPEVQRKKEIERINNLKRKNRILKDVYNKNLQRKVLKGQVDLSNSVRVIQDYP
ncbi:centrosome-associated protein Alms1a-like [Anopheles maculipalpis]|uniref:centrosome-associated protein Alms1a-like n=1 Tax=Anopheles maculipalpis TaxID=1496333 RepID=UPI002158A2A4|nr:centrosome-associated protein Alms1a-like [Anopheles maculipalpis]